MGEYTPEKSLYALDWDVYPIHKSDQNKAFWHMMSWCFTYDKVLDAAKLRNSLAALLEIGDWRKIGARLRYKQGDQDKLEAYVPKHFTTEQPAFMFHQSDFSHTAVKDHSLSSLHVRSRDHAFTQRLPKTFPAELIPPNVPQSFADLISRQLPNLSVHVITFRDATMVVLTLPHLTDACGLGDLFRNWSLVLAGKAAEVGPLLSAREDVLGGLVETATETWEIERQSMGWLAKLCFSARWVAQWFHAQRFEMRTGFIPGPVYRKLLSDARDHVSQANPSKPNDPALAITDSDIVFAWFSKIMAGEPTPRPIISISLVNLRFRIPALQSPRGSGDGASTKAYYQNMVQSVIQSFTSEQMLEPIGRLAVCARKQMRAHATEGQMLAQLKRNYGDRQILPLSGDGMSTLFMFNNLIPTGLGSAPDFEPAAVNSAAAAGTVSGVSGGAVVPARIPLSTFTLLERDKDGNFWFSGVLLESVWQRIDAELARMQHVVGSPS